MSTTKIHDYDKLIYLLQGGGALGSYQVGVCEALFGFGCAPDWVVGTSIGAINAAIIVGNKPENRISKLKEFWNTIASPTIPSLPFCSDNFEFREWHNFWSAQWGAQFGQPGFFKPRPFSPWLFPETTPDQLSYYDTSELRDTLEKLVDFDLINQKKVRLSLEAIHIKTGKVIHFDNTRQTIGSEHVMASCALPPGFPAVEVDKEYYWDGGISSNMPLRIVLEEKVPKKLLCFVVDLFSFPGYVPTSMMDVMSARKNLEYASRHQEILHYFCESQYFEYTLNSLSKKIHQDELALAVKAMESMGHPAFLNLVRFHYKNCPSDLWSRDYNFSADVLEEHLRMGYQDAKKALKETAWLELMRENACGVIHEF